MSIFNGVAGNRGHNPIGAVIHNDAGSQSANAAHYQNWLPGINRKTDLHTTMCVRTERSMPRMTGTVPGIAVMAGETMSSILSRSARAWGT